MLKIGLTGGIGSGKSSVAKWFLNHHVPVLDADQIVHQLYDDDGKTVSLLVNEFGKGIIYPNGKIDRKELGSMVFGNESARKRLEKIVHHRVFEVMNNKQKLIEGEGFRICVWDVPLLFETGMDKLVNEIWVIWVPQDIQLKRVTGRDKLSEEEIIARIKAQMPLDEKALRADIKIDNSGSWQETELQLEIQWSRLKKIINGPVEQ